MSDWEVYTGDPTASEKLKSISNNSDWEILGHRNNPTISEALSEAPGKVAQDVYGGIQNFASKIPGYYKEAKTEFPAAINLMEKNPQLSQKNKFAGLAQLGQKVFNTPHDFINYLSERLNLFPKDINKMVQMGRMPEDTQQMINQQYGMPQQPGEALLRGAPGAIFNTGTMLTGVGGLNALKPSQYIRRRANSISNEYMAAKKLERNVFSKVFDKYGANPITNDANQFFSNLGIERKRLLPDAQLIYDETLKNPTLKNIHKLQSQISGDANKVFENYPNKYQRLRQYKNKLLESTEAYLEKTDKNALKNYNIGRQITRDLVSPYTSNTLLEQVSKGVHPKVTHKELTEAIKKGQRDIIYEKEGKPVTAIHPGHKLSNHLKKIEKRNFLNKIGIGVGSGLGGTIIGNEIYRNFLKKNEGNY